MSVFTIFGFIFVTGLYVALILLAVYSYRAVKRKKIKRSCVLIGLMLLLLWWMGGPMRVLPGSNIIHERSQMKSLTGHAFRMQEIGKAERSERSFNGDGTSFEMYVLPDEVAAELTNPPAKFFTSYPQRDGFRSDWEIENWKKAKPLGSEEKFLEFAQYACESASNRALFWSLLQEEGNYYSYFYYMHDWGDNSSVGNIDFFILSPRRKLLVIINVNT